jgi:hypothetical protein
LHVHVAEETNEVLQAPTEPIDAPGHYDIEPAPAGVFQEPIECRPLVTPLGPADAVVDVLLDHLPAGALGNLAQRHELNLRIPETLSVPSKRTGKVGMPCCA